MGESVSQSKKKSPKNPGGRPPAVTEAVLQKLEQAFTYGYSDREACLYAGISERTLYYYCEKNPEFLQRKEALKDQPNMLAKMNVFNKLSEGDKDLSKWQLERRDNAYNPTSKTENTHLVEHKVIFKSGSKTLEIGPGTDTSE